ncbi:MAG: type I glutamate--ammonia ligase [Bacillota bacterium]|nr:type I glutamate--ammonia ligase [Bacillota bacterium]
MRPSDADEVLELARRSGVVMIDLRLTDVPGRWHHITMPVEMLDRELFVSGVPFDGSSIPGFRSIEESDMVMVPDPTTAFLDPFTEAPTLVMTCDVVEPDGASYSRDPRSVAKRAEAYLKSTGIATKSYWGPELEFFIFDKVTFHADQGSAGYSIDSVEAEWNRELLDSGSRIRPKTGYFPVAPLDQLQDVRTAMVRNLQAAGLPVERHHHEVATAGQAEINFRRDTLTRTADNVQLYKYIIRNTARRYGKTVTFMPKPLYGDNGSGMHTHQSLFDEERPLFYDQQGYARLSAIGRYYVGGLLVHAPSILALSNPTTNSYRRLIPGFEAPVNLVFGKANRSAAVRVPVGSSKPESVRIEFRPPDATGNPYLSFAAMLMAGLDGILNRIEPSELGFGPLERNVYTLSPEERARIRSVPGSLEEALDALERDHDFLLRGGVFDEQLIADWIESHRKQDVEPVRQRPHPYEFYLYWDV